MIDDPRWDGPCECLHSDSGGVHQWVDGVCTICDEKWDDRHFDKDGICVICCAGDTNCGWCWAETLCRYGLCPSCTEKKH